MRGPGAKLSVTGLLAASVMLASTASFGGFETLQNDSFTDGGTAWAQMGFVTGEMAAVTLGPVSDTFTVNNIKFLFGGGGTAKTLTLHIYEDTGAVLPGNEIYSADYQVTPADDSIQSIDLSADMVVHDGAGSIRVALEMPHSNLPSVMRDDDGNSGAGNNWIYASDTNWYDSYTFPLPSGVPGDWIIRAEIETAGSTGGGGSGGSGQGASGGSGGNGASGGSGAVLCTPGQSIACVGPGACQGGQVCMPAGNGYGPCECGAGNEDSGDSGGCALAGRTPDDALRFALASLGVLGLALLSRRRLRG
jgi:hypothetical protein